MFRTSQLLLLAASLAAPLHAGNWPEFRGPHGDGHSDARHLPMDWSEQKNVTWKTPVPGRGWSTPVIWGSQIWFTTATDDGKEMSVLCLDRATGKVLHQELLYRNDKPEPLGNPVNGYASPSAVIEAGRAYIHFGSYGTCAIDTASFKRVWDRRDLPCRHYRGPGSSLFLYGNSIILSMDGVDFQYLAALDKATGKTLWRADRTTQFNDLDAGGKPKADGDYRKAYTTPNLALIDGKKHLISSGSKATFAYDPDTGKELWHVTYDGFSNASSPVFADGMAFINTGYGKANLLAVPVQAASTGDLTRLIAWEIKKRVPLRSSPLVHDGILYMVADDGQITAVEAKTGKEVWADRLEGNFSASPVLSEGRLLFCNEQGVSYWLEAGREKKVLGQGKLDDGVLASPVAVDSELYLRTKSHVYRIETRP